MLNASASSRKKISDYHAVQKNNSSTVASFIEFASTIMKKLDEIESDTGTSPGSETIAIAETAPGKLLTIITEIEARLSKLQMKIRQPKEQQEDEEEAASLLLASAELAAVASAPGAAEKSTPPLTTSGTAAKGPQNAMGAHKLSDEYAFLINDQIAPAGESLEAENESGSRMMADKYNEWDDETQFFKGNRVHSQGILYEMIGLQPTAGKPPFVNSPIWRAIFFVPVDEPQIIACLDLVIPTGWVEQNVVLSNKIKNGSKLGTYYPLLPPAPPPPHPHPPCIRTC
jgi:hypothetical protein